MRVPGTAGFVFAGCTARGAAVTQGPTPPSTDRESIPAGDSFEGELGLVLEPTLQKEALDYELYAVGSVAEP